MLRARPLHLLGAGALSGCLVLLSAGPGLAAQPVAQAEAVGLVLTVASMPTDSGAYRVTNDGTEQTATGNHKPLITALGHQPFLSAGTLAQDATTSVDADGRGSSAACAGLAGDGATLAAAGEGSCLTPGKNLDLNAGTLDLSNLTIAQADVLAGLDQQLQTALQPVLDALLPALQDGLQTALSSLGLGVVLDLGAIQSSCTAGPATADGDADLADVSLYVNVGGQKVSLLKLPVHPAPNTKILTNLDAVVDDVSKAIQKELKTVLMGQLSALGPLAGQLISAINDNLVSTIAGQLAPLEKNVLDGTLNEQKRSPGAIDVTALDLHVLPAAEGFGVDLLSLKVGESKCGPSGRYVAPTPPKPHHHKHPTPPKHHVPHVIPSGLASAPDDHHGLELGGALAGLVLLSGAAGVTTYRRALRS